MKATVFFMSEFNYEKIGNVSDDEILNQIRNTNLFVDSTNVVSPFVLKYFNDVFFSGNDGKQINIFKFDKACIEENVKAGKDDQQFHVKIRKGLEFFFITDKIKKSKQNDIGFSSFKLKLNNIYLLIGKGNVGVIVFEVSYDPPDKNLSIDDFYRNVEDLIYIMRRSIEDANEDVNYDYPKRLQSILKSGCSVNILDTIKTKNETLVRKLLAELGIQGINSPIPPEYKDLVREKIATLSESNKKAKIPSLQKTKAFIFDKDNNNPINWELFQTVIFHQLKCIKCKPFFYLNDDAKHAARYYAYSIINTDEMLYLSEPSSYQKLINQEILEKNKIYQMRFAFGQNRSYISSYDDEIIYNAPYDNIRWAFTQGGASVILYKDNVPESNFVENQMPEKLENSYFALFLLSRYQYASCMNMLLLSNKPTLDITELNWSWLSWRRYNNIEFCSLEKQYQMVFSSLYKINRIDELSKKIAYNLETLEKEENERKEERTRKITIAFSVLVICSVLIDGTEFIKTIFEMFLPEGGSLTIRIVVSAFIALVIVVSIKYVSSLVRKNPNRKKVDIEGTSPSMHYFFCISLQPLKWHTEEY